MARFDNEENIIESFQRVKIPEILPLPKPSEELEEILLSIKDENNWKIWINSSGKDAPPPDFYNPKLKLMMDVMRVDDHTFVSKKGKLVNPTNARISKVENEIRETGFFDNNPECQFDALVDTGLPTEEDHNYKFYKDCFVRVATNHIKKINLYKKNHPNYKLIFFVCDESSMYMEGIYKPKEYKINQLNIARPHVWWEDEAFIKCLKNSGIDYLIWYAPYKLAKYLVEGEIRNMPIPKVIIYGKDYFYYEHLNYNDELMSSTEV